MRLTASLPTNTNFNKTGQNFNNLRMTAYFFLLLSFLCLAVIVGLLANQKRERKY